MCRHSTLLYKITNTKFTREGYYADLNSKWTVAENNPLYKCGWSTLERTIFQTEIKQTFVNGNAVHDYGLWNEKKKGMVIDFTTENALH
ncbi:MAG: dihydroorotase [Cryomorphaceae bacterium]|jgi:dihydroorotase